MLGDYLYQLSARDQVSNLIQLIHVSKTNSANNQSVPILDIFQVPDGYIFHLQNAHLLVTGGGIATPNSCYFTAVAHGENYRFGGGIANQPIALHDMSFPLMGGAIIFEPLTTFHAATFLSAANVGNRAEATLIGYLIPRGLVALG